MTTIPGFFMDTMGEYVGTEWVPYPPPPIWFITQPPAVRAVDADPRLPPFLPSETKEYAYVGWRPGLDHGPEVAYREIGGVAWGVPSGQPTEGEPCTMTL